MATAPAVPLDRFLKGKERKELETKLARYAELKIQRDQIEQELRGDGDNPGLTDEIAAFLMAHGQRKVEFEGFTHAILESANVSYSKDKIQASLLKYGVDPDIISNVLREAKKVTPYTTITTMPVKELKPKGGLTGR